MFGMKSYISRTVISSSCSEHRLFSLSQMNLSSYIQNMQFWTKYYLFICLSNQKILLQIFLWKLPSVFSGQTKIIDPNLYILIHCSSLVISIKLIQSSHHMSLQASLLNPPNPKPQSPSQVTIYRLTESLLNQQQCDIDSIIRNRYNTQQRKLIIVDRSKGKIIDSRLVDVESVLQPSFKKSLYLPQNHRPISKEETGQQYIYEKLEDSVEKFTFNNQKSIWEDNWKELDRIHQQFLQAILKNQPYAVFNFLEKGSKQLPIDINYRFQSNWSPLHYAAMHSSIQIISRLINHPRINLNVTTDFGETPLHIAAKSNNLENCQLLISAGVLLDQKDKDLNTALHYAAQLGSKSIVEMLLQNGASQSIRNSCGMTAVDLASSQFTSIFNKYGSNNNREDAVDQLYRFRSMSNHKAMVQKMLQYKPERQGQNKAVVKQQKRQKLNATSMRRKNIFKMYEFIRESHKIETISLSCFKFYKKIGEGAFGEVYLVKKGTFDKLYALKAIRKERVFGTSLYRYIQTQKEVLSLINHPCIVKLRYAFQTESHLFLVMDYCEGGDLSKLLQKKKKFQQKVVKNYACEILLGLEALHKNNILYRDLKPENIVLDREGHALITDFGLSKRTENLDSLNKSFCGTPAYLPLEIINKKGHTRMADWYEFGVVVYQLYTGFPPFFADTKAELYDLVRQGVIRFPKNTPEIFRDLIKKLLAQNPQKRLGFQKDADSIKQHPWMADVDWQAVLDRRLVMPAIENKVKIGDPIKTKFHDVKSQKFQIPMWSFVE